MVLKDSAYRNGNGFTLLDCSGFEPILPHRIHAVVLKRGIGAVDGVNMIRDALGVHDECHQTLAIKPLKAGLDWVIRSISGDQLGRCNMPRGPLVAWYGPFT